MLQALRPRLRHLGGEDMSCLLACLSDKGASLEPSWLAACYAQMDRIPWVLQGQHLVGGSLTHLLLVAERFGARKARNKRTRLCSIPEGNGTEECLCWVHGTAFCACCCWSARQAAIVLSTAPTHRPNPLQAA